MSINIDKATKALREAHKQGNEQDARRIANAIKEQRQQSEQKVEQEAIKDENQEIEKSEGGIAETTYNIGANLTAGLSTLFGMPGDIDETVFTEESLFPTSDEIQGQLAEWGMTYEPGEEPQDLGSRTLRELGMVGIPIAGTAARGATLAKRGVQSSRNLFEKAALASSAKPGATAAIESSALYGTVFGGKLGEEVFEDNPQLGRAVGELAGGLGGGFVGAGGGTKALIKAGKSVSPFTRAAGKERAVGRVSRGTQDPSAARQNIEETEDVASEVPELTPAQRSNDPYLADLEKAVRAENDLAREELVNKTAEASRKLKEIAQKTGDPEDVRAYLDKRLQLASAKAFKSGAALRGRPTPEKSASQAREYLKEAYEDAREREREVWDKVASDVTTTPSATKSAWQEELENITRGADESEIPDFVKKKLGKLNKRGKLVGGQLSKNPTAKELHQFYSAIGRKLSSEEATKGFNQNTVRILKKIRSSVLEDLEQADDSQSYQEAINLSKDLNEKFTQGSVGEILGFARSGGPTNTTETLEALMGSGGEKARNSIKQFLEASPQASEQVKDYIRSRFVDAAFDPDKDAINAKNASKFVSKYRPILREFPGLKEELMEAARDQKKVDELMAVSDHHDLSPHVRQKRAAGVFLQSDPGEEIGRVISSTRNSPKSLKAQFKELVDEVEGDETGRAKEGLKRAFAEHVMIPSGMEDAQGELLINGKKMTQRLNELENSSVSSGLMNKEEIDRLKKIAKVFEGIQRTEKGQGAAEGVIGDRPDMMMNALARIASVQAGRAIPSGGSGASIQTANIASNIGQKLAQKMTVTGARKILTDAVNDPKLMKDLLKRVDEMGIKEREKLAQKLTKKLPNPPQAGTLPSASTAAQEDEQQ